MKTLDLVLLLTAENQKDLSRFTNANHGVNFRNAEHKLHHQIYDKSKDHTQTLQQKGIPGEEKQNKTNKTRDSLFIPN